MKNFFASFLGTIAAIALMVTGLVVVVVVLVVAASSLKQPAPTVEAGSYLVFNLSANITDAPPAYDGMGPAALLGGGKDSSTLQLRTVTRALQAAGKDPHIAGVVMLGSLAPEGYGTGFAALAEVRESLAAFKKSGKPVIAYLDFATTRDLYLTAGATDLVLDPYGSLVVPGLASEPTFFAGAFERFGVGVQVTKVGEFKSYAEPYVRKDLSPANREQLEKLLGDLWGDLLGDLATDRKMSPADLQALIDSEGIISPESAVKAGLVDRLAYRDEVLTKLKSATGRTDSKDPFKQIDLAAYVRTLPEPQTNSTKQIAVIYAEGAIVDGEGSEGEIGGARFARELRALREDDKVKAIVLRVNSPGGSATASEHIQRELRLAGDVKPVVVSMGSYAASGGYWISAYSDRIYAEPTTITGSIGVVGIHFDVKKLANDLGITWDGVKTGKYADIFTVSRPKTPSELAIFQGMVEWIYGEFIRKVAEGRKLDPADVRKIAGGRVWSGREALKLGLVDELGGLDAAIAHAVEAAGLRNDYELVEFPQSQTFAEMLAAWLENSHSPETKQRGLVSQVINQVQEQAKTLGQFNDPRGVYARLPLEITLP
ncbi:MAG: signal peptide peptidase SppA [Opitutaceae bacterium]|jgi:protease-4